MNKGEESEMCRYFIHNYQMAAKVVHTRNNGGQNSLNGTFHRHIFSLVSPLSIILDHKL